MGDEMVVKCVGIDENGRVRLSGKAAAVSAVAAAPAEPAPDEPAGTPGA